MPTLLNPRELPREAADCLEGAFVTDHLFPGESPLEPATMRLLRERHPAQFALYQRAVAAKHAPDPMAPRVLMTYDVGTTHRTKPLHEVAEYVSDLRATGLYGDVWLECESLIDGHDTVRYVRVWVRPAALACVDPAVLATARAEAEAAPARPLTYEDVLGEDEYEAAGQIAAQERAVTGEAA